MNLPKILLTIVGLLFVSRANGSNPDRALESIKRALDLAQKHVDEYGTMSISAPILTYARSNEFAFRLTNGAAYYFNSARTNTQGRVASFDQSQQSLIVQARMQSDPTIAGAYVSSLQEYTRQSQAYQLQQQAVRQAATLELESAIAAANTNSTLGASNQAVAEALRKYGSQVYETNGPPVFPTASSFNANLPSAPAQFAPLLTDTNYGRLQAMKEFLGLLSTMPSGLSISDRAALLTAAGDNGVESFFRALGDSQLYTNFLNREIYYGAMLVSVNPGWRTQKDWAAEVNVRVELEFSEARRPTIARVLSDPKWPIDLRTALAQDYGYPLTVPDAETILEGMGVANTQTKTLVTAAKAGHAARRETMSIPRSLQRKVPGKPVETMVISPMIEAENFDLASSYRQQSEFALALSAALTYTGAKGQAEIFEKFAKSRQFDIASRSPLATVNAFSSQEGSFGFQIGPRPRALADATKRKGGPGNVLERQAFPALLVLTVSAGELEPRIMLTTNECCIQFKLEEPYLAFRQTRRWIPLTRAFFSARDWYLPRQWFHPKLSEGERMDAAHGLEMAGGQISELNWTTKFSISPHSTMADSLRERFKFYQRELIGTVDTVALPPDRLIPLAEQEPSKKLKTVSITGVFPEKVVVKVDANQKVIREPSKFVFFGSNLDLVKANASALYDNTSPPDIERYRDYVIVRAEVTKTSAPVIFKFDLEPGALATTLFSPPVRVEESVPLDSVVFPPEIVAVSPKTVTLKRNSNGQPQENNVSLFLLGKGLSRVDLRKEQVQLVSGKANVVKAEALGDGIKVELRITEGGEPIVLRFNADIQNNAPKSFVLAPGVQVEVEAPWLSEPTTKSGFDVGSLSPLSAVVVTVATNAPSVSPDVSISISASKTNAQANKQ